MIVATDDQTARFIGSSTKLRNARMPSVAKSSTAVVVRRGSQSHQTPQVGFAQIEPWQQSRNANSVPTSSPASRRASHFMSLRKRNAIAQYSEKSTDSIQFHAVGTCTYMMRCTSPMYCSGGATKRPAHEPNSSSATPNEMNRSEERRVGKECRSRWAPDQSKKK